MSVVFYRVFYGAIPFFNDFDGPDRPGVRMLIENGHAFVHPCDGWDKRFHLGSDPSLRRSVWVRRLLRLALASSVLDS
jgi:hypothetical protein